MARLRRSDCSEPGHHAPAAADAASSSSTPTASRIDDEETLARIRELAIPPAWKDVWICSDPTGHLQATGIDAAGRKQYLYHPRWRTRRDQQKFDEMLEFARALPRLRRRVAARPRGAAELGREQVLACAVRLLDRGFFRIGSRGLRRAERELRPRDDAPEHVTPRRRRDRRSTTPAKSGQRRVQAIVDPDVRAGRDRAASAAAAAARSCSPIGRAALGGRPLRRHQRVRQGGDRRRLLREGLPHLERDDARGGRARVDGASAKSKTARKRRDQRGGQGRRVLPRQHAGGVPRRPTSTRACSTASATARPSCPR